MHTLPKHLIFDWGDTLMADLPGRTDPMYQWPEVKLMPGIDLVLPHLAKHHVLSVATNAYPSRHDEVRRALERGGISQYFTHIFCAADLGVQKQEMEFWEKVVEKLGIKPEEACMIGDSIEADVIAPGRAGLHAIWYYPQRDQNMTVPHFITIQVFRELLTSFREPVA